MNAQFKFVRMNPLHLSHKGRAGALNENFGCYFKITTGTLVKG